MADTHREIDLQQIDVLSFDCYGTLVDWESGILSALKVVLAAHGAHPAAESILADYSEFEAAAEEGEFREYREVLRSVVRGFGAKYAFIPSARELDTLVRSLPQWRPFADTVDVLSRLKRRYKLAILSNVDDSLFAHTARALVVELDYVITAYQVRSYKPSLNNFRALLSRVGVPPDRILHVAQSLYHDVVPAKQCGLATVWVNRPSQRQGLGATPAVDAQPDVVVQDLAALASRLSL
jgi:2-haloacid dehalogenase